MKSHIVTMILTSLVSVFSCRSETINGPANIRTKNHNATFCSLYDKVDVDCTVLLNDWFQIGFCVKISQEQYKKHIPPKKGDKIFNLKGKEIGEIIADIPAGYRYEFSYGGAPGIPEVFGLQIYGYTHRSNIYANSIVENPLKALIQANSKTPNFEQFRILINDFAFRQEGLLKEIYPKLTEYMIYENAIDDPSPIDRVRLIFENKNLIAIIHSRELNISGFDDVPLERGLHLLIFRTPTGVTRKHFIQKNIESYWGVD